MLAAYDLGATSSHLKKIYEAEAEIQRPIFVEEKDASISVDDSNWIQYLGNQRWARSGPVCMSRCTHDDDSAYGSFFKYFSGKVADLGVGPALEKFVFDRAANEDGKSMLIRVMSGA